MVEMENKIKEWQYTVDSYNWLTDEDVVSMMQYIADINVIEIKPLTEKVAYLFNSILRKAKVENHEQEIACAVKAAFKNIQRMDTESQQRDCADIRIIHFLRKIFSENLTSNDDRIVLDLKNLMEDFQVLAENLERIHVIFKLQIQGEILFQIGTLLKSVIMQWNPNNFRLTSENIHIVFLAVQVFKVSKDKDSAVYLEQIVNECDLQFLRYLQKDRIEQLGGAVWKKNYEYNGVLVIADTTEHKILIRSEDKQYLGDFGKPEINVNGQVIAFYREVSYVENAIFTDAEAVLRKGNKKKLLLIVKLLLEGYLNIFQPSSLLETEETLEVVNNNTNKDKFIILGNGDIKRNMGFSELDDLLKPYWLRVIAGKGIDCLTLGTVLYLMKKRQVPYKKLITDNLLNGSDIQNGVFLNWLCAIKEPVSGWYQLKEMFLEELKYTYLEADYSKKGLNGLRLYPIKLDLPSIQKILIGYLLGTDCVEGTFLKAKIQIDFTKGISVKILSKNEIISVQSITWIEGDEFVESLMEEDEITVWCDSAEKYYSGREIIRFFQTITEADSRSRGLLPLELIKAVQENDVQKILKLMELQADGLSEDINYDGDKDSLGRFRLVSQLCYFQINNEKKFAAYNNLLGRHSKVDYKYLESERGKFFEQGVLYVPKEKKECLGTLYHINEKLLKSNAYREVEHLYHTLLELDSEGYYTFLGTRIKKIVFLFDTVQRGAGTIHSICSYFEHAQDTEWFEDDGKEVGRKKKVMNYAQMYVDKENKQIFLEDIIKKNGLSVCDIKIRCFYGANEGIENIKNYCNEQGKGHDCLKSVEVIVDREISDICIVTDEDRKVIKDLFGICDIGKGSYMISRQFNMSKQNIFPEKALNPQSIISIFLKKSELKK